MLFFLERASPHRKPKFAINDENSAMAGFSHAAREQPSAVAGFQYAVLKQPSAGAGLIYPAREQDSLAANSNSLQKQETGQERTFIRRCFPFEEAPPVSSPYVS